MKKLLLGLVLVATSCMGDKGTYPGPQSIPTTGEKYEKTFGHTSSLISSEYQERAEKRAEKRARNNQELTLTRKYIELVKRIPLHREYIEKLLEKSDDVTKLAEAKSYNDKLNQELGQMQNLLGKIAQFETADWVRDEQSKLNDARMFYQGAEKAIMAKTGAQKKNKK